MKDSTKIYSDYSLFGVSWRQSVSNWLLDISAANTHAVCTAQGGYYTEDDSEPVTSNLYANWSIGAWNLKRDINGTPIFDFSGSIIGLDFLAGISPVTDGFDFNFIPTMSALDMNYYWRPQNANADLTLMSTQDIMARTPFDVIVGGAPTNAVSPYDVNWPTSFGNDPVIWDIDQNNLHESIVRNENVLIPHTDEIGWLLREIGDRELWLENYTLQHEASFFAEEGIKAGDLIFPHYNYDSQLQSTFMAGVYSKEQPMLITSTGDAFMQYNFTSGGVFQDVGVVLHGNLQDQDINLEACTTYTGYNRKKLPTSSEKLDLNSEDLNIFPNPSLGVVNIQSNKDLYSVELFTLSGELILKNKPNSLRNHTLDLSHYAQGVYFLKVYSNQTVFTYKIQKL